MDHNFAVMRYLGQREATFAWTAEDESGISDFSYVLDRSPETVPDEKSEGPQQTKT